MFDIFVQTFIFTGLIILVLWITSILIKDVSIIDTAFAPIILLITLFSVYLSNSSLLIKFTIFSVIFIWSIRLTLLMLQRKIGHGEDPRYTKLREWKDPGLDFNFFALKQVFLLQGIVIWCVTLPIQFSLTFSIENYFSFFNYLGLLFMIVGFLWEVIGDNQLNNFKKDINNKNKFLKNGLWALSRHPNYFGEIVFWWGVFVFSILSPISLISIIGPIVFTYLLINVTGVRTMDKRMAKNYEGYSEYIKITNSIIPKFNIK